MKETFFSYQPWSHYREWVNFHTVFVGDEGPGNSRLKVGGYKGKILMCDNGIASEYGKFAADTVTTLVLHNSDACRTRQGLRQGARLGRSADFGVFRRPRNNRRSHCLMECQRTLFGQGSWLDLR